MINIQDCSPLVNVSINLSEAESAHCKSSKNTARGCSGLANTFINLWNVSKKRFCVSLGPSSGNAGCSPIITSSSGITSVITPPLFSRSRSIFCFQFFNSSSGSLSSCLTNS